MATTEVFHNGNGSSVTFSIPFEYLEESDVKVSVGGVLKATTEYTFSSLTQITFDTAPPSGTNNVRIFRDTDIDSGVRNEFFAGSAIRAQDLNDDFLQVLFSAQEIEDQFVTKTDGEFDSNVDMNNNRITDMADPVNAQDAVTKQYLEDNYFDDGTETILSSETWPDNDTTIATTAAVDNRVDSKIDTAIEGDVLIDNTGLTKFATGGQVTLGIGANSVDLDRIKNTDIITSSESNPNNDTTIATTAKIDDMIDAAITGDVLVGDGLTRTTGSGQVTISINAGSVDLDRIKADDIITLAEQNAGPATDDDSIFTSSAAAKRFDTIVQTGTPSNSPYPVGKTWLQNDDDQTLKIWNGSTWLDVASGGSFRTQDKVIYVDATGGDDSKTGHRISGPKLTIKAAINDINADIDISVFLTGALYADGVYDNVPLNGGTTGSGLTGTITVSNGSVTSVTNVSNTLLQEYQIGDILTINDSNVGSGGGSGCQLKVTGGGDGMTVIVAAGTYQEIAPIQIKRRNVSIIGMALRSCIVHPTPATEKPASAGNSALFELNSGSFIQNLTLTGMKASNSGNNSIDSDLPDKQGWNFAFYNNAFITKSPYVQNCTNFSDSQIVNTSLLFDPHNPAGGQAGDLTNAPTGGGMLIDGSVPKTTSPLRSMVADSYTHVGLNGPGILVTNNGYAQCTSSYAFFNKYHIKALNGGQANLAASTTDFGEKALVADGKSTAAIFTATVNGAASNGDLTFDIDNVTAGTGWFGDDTKPAGNMLVTVNSITYPILSSTVITGGHRVTISRPDPNNRSTNLGLNGAVADDAAVSFFLRSQIASSGHTMEYVGSGMDYDALPENGGVPDETKQITELNNGKVWTAVTDHNGKFKIGGNQTDDPIFEVDQQLGFVTIPEGSVAFNLLSDLTPQLGGNLDVNGSQIVTDSGNENIVLNPHGTGVVDVSTSRITNVTDPTGNQDAATKNYVDNVAAPDKISEGNTEAEVVDSGSNGHFKVTTEGTERLRIDSSGRVGIGSTAPGHNLEVKGSFPDFAIVDSDTTNDKFRILHNGGGTQLMVDPNNVGPNASHFLVSVDGSERMRLDSSGRLLAGTSTSTSSNGQALIQAASTSNDRLITAYNFENDASGPYISLGKSRGTSVGSFTILQNNDELGNIAFFAADGTDLNTEGARIQAEVDGTPGTNDMPTRLVFSTTADGANNPTERLRIDSSGNVGIGTTSPGSFSSGANTLVVGTSSGNAGITINNGAADQIGSIFFAEGTGANAIGRIRYEHANNAMAFSTDSSERMRIDSSGRVGVGTSAPYNVLTGKSLSIGNGVGAAEVNFLSATDAFGSIYFGDGTSGNATTRGSLEYVHTDDSMRFGVAASERMRIDSSGNVGIGCDNPQYQIDLSASSLDHLFTGAINAEQDGGDYALKLTALGKSGGRTGSVRFITGQSTSSGSERMRIDGSGNLVIGTTSNALGKLTVFEGGGFSSSTLTAGDNIYLISDATSGNNVYGASIAFSRVQYADRKHAAIAAVQTSSDEDHVGLAFFTHPSSNAADAMEEALRIASDGHVLVGHTDQFNTDGLLQAEDSGNTAIALRSTTLANNEHVNFTVSGQSSGGSGYRLAEVGVFKNAGNTNPGGYFRCDQPDGDNAFLWVDNNGQFRISNTLSHVGTTSDGSVVGTQTSDERVKNVGAAVAYGLSQIKQLQPKQFEYKKDLGVNKIGFIAQEVESIIPEAVYDTNQELEGHQDGDRTKLGMEYVAIIPVLVNAVKELSAEVDTLKAKVAALEAAE